MSDTIDAIRQPLRDRYRIERLLGEGGMATVYLAHDLRHDRRVAVKVLRPELAQSIGVERFHREIGIAARLNHPHILPLLDSGTFQPGDGRSETAYYVMPFVEGESLRDRLKRDGRLPVAEAVRLAREVADALDHAHRRGVIHRDIKPENILLSEQHAVVADFGIARALDEASTDTITRTGQVVGTPAYMSPEQLLGVGPVDGRADLYALGCTLFEMISGQQPWSGGPATALMARRLTEPAPRIRAFEPTVPPAVESALVKSLAREPDQRFDTPAAFAAALESGSAPPPVAARRWAVGVGVALVLVAAALQVRSLLRGGRHVDAVRTIAVVPDTPDSLTRYLSDGVLEAVVDLLRQLPHLRLTSPRLVEQIQRQQPELNVEELGQRLDVGAVLTWSLRRSGDSVLLNAELLRVPGGALVWSGRYRRAMSEVLRLQSEVAQTVADSLQLQLTGKERADLEQRPTTNASAYELYLRGRHFYTLATPAGVRGAQELADSVRYYAERALALDPGFVRAQSLIANYHFLSAVRGWRSPFGVELDSAIALSNQALARDSTSGDAWADVVTANIYFYDDWEIAKRQLGSALARSPTHPMTWNFYAIYIGEVEGRLDSAIALSRRAAELDAAPQTLNTLGDLYMRARQYDSAIVVLRRAIALDPTVPGPRLRLVTVYERLGRYAEAVAERASWLGDAAARPFTDGLATAGASGYRAALAQQLRARIDSLLPQVGGPRQYPRDTLPPIPETRLALLYGQLEDWKSATDWVIKEHDRRPKRLRLWLTHPDMQGLRGDPRFMALVRKERLVVP